MMSAYHLEHMCSFQILRWVFLSLLFLCHSLATSVSRAVYATMHAGVNESRFRERGEDQADLEDVSHIFSILPIAFPSLDMVCLAI